MFLHLLFLCCTSSSVFARQFAAKSDLLPKLCGAAIKHTEKLAATASLDSADGVNEGKCSIGGIPPWINCVMGIAVAMARLQPEKPKADGLTGVAPSLPRNTGMPLWLVHPL